MNYCDPMKIREIASIAHEMNKSWCELIGDTSQVSWDEAPEWQRASAINGVRFYQEYPGSSPCDSHNSWLSEKLAEGWSYGPVKDVDSKTHPCCVPYDDLPAVQKAKDSFFLTVVRTLLEQPEELYNEH